ncbi:MAG: hemerythrin family protein [Bacteroidales bacterium]|nr:hemerythrin family protein [Bacteroidales bacterium]
MELANFEWRDEFSINIPIDKDHKHLINIIDKLVQHINQKGDREEFAKILSAMTDYAMQHFKKEELYMKQFNYPQLKEHKAFHKKYIITTIKYNLALLNYVDTDPAEIAIFLSDWWTRHILVADAAYEKYRLEIHSDAVYGEEEL